MSRLNLHAGLLAALVLFGGHSIIGPSVPRPSTLEEASQVHLHDEITVVADLTAEQERFVAWGESRFAAAGLTPPQLQYVFHDDTEACGWHRGLYDPEKHVVIICNANRETLVHELAHAWVEANVSAELKADFMAQRGLEVWNDHEVPWSERATEHAAEVVAWGVEEESRLIPWVEPDGTRIFRLLTIPDSTPDELLAAYQMLTGREAALRSPSEWEEAPREATSPEGTRSAG